jgi:hypothetical protein
MAQGVQAGSFHKIPLSDAIYQAKQMLLKMDTVVEDDILEIFAWQAVRETKALSSFITEVREFEICNGEVQLPKYLFRFLWFRPCCSAEFLAEQEENENNVPTSGGWYYLYVDTPWLNSCGCDVATNGNFSNLPGVIRINNDKLVFNGTRDYNFDRVQIAGIYYNTDENGVFVLYDHHVPNIVYRICAQSLLMHNKMAQSREYRNLATAAGNGVRSTDFTQNFQQNIDQIQNMYKAYNYAPLVSRNRSRY